MGSIRREPGGPDEVPALCHLAYEIAGVRIPDTYHAIQGSGHDAATVW
ncbi:hypothetical protein OHA71_23280 [Streptomyces sp. NBC_00444]